MTTYTLALLVILSALVAMAYAAVGLGGGTGYLALMTLFDVPHDVMPSTALALNIVVTSAAVARYGSARLIRWDLLAPFLVFALPTAFAGGLVNVPRRAFMALLAIALVAVAAAMARSASRPVERVAAPNPTVLWTSAAIVGTAIGLSSGMLGIGGGVFLGPVILLAGWADTRETVAITSVTVLTLSVAGLAAHGLRGTVDPAFILPLAAATLVGGLVGAHLSLTRLSPTALKRLFAVVILIAAVKAAWTAFGGP